MTYTGDEIAVVGMACRVPGADDPQTLWRHVVAGGDTLRRFTAGAGPGHVPVFGHLDDLELFDAEFFGIDPQAARRTDPQHRIFLQLCWQAVEDAGYDIRRHAGQTAIFAGTAASRYLLGHLLGNPAVDDGGDPATVLWPPNSPDHLPTLVAYHLGLTGPAVAVQTACSSSLVAVCQAAQSLNDYRCDLAIAGGVAVVSTVPGGYRHRPGSLTTPDGRCRPLDDAAAGSVFGNGAAAVVLKRLADATADGDHIHAVLRGWAVDNDGSARAGYAAPGVDGQAAVVVEALRAGEVDAATVGFAELHAAGTRLGDALELAALTRAFRTDTEARGFCAVGAVKATVGNLDAAAGAVGLIKAIQAVGAGVLPVAAGVETPNSEVDWDDVPFYLPGGTDCWPASDSPRRAVVTSFGLGGTNACVVVEQAPDRPATAETGPQVLRLSARTPAALARMRARLRAHLLHRPEPALADVAFTLHEGRALMPHRWSATCHDLAGAVASLAGEDADPASASAGPVPAGRRVPLPGYPFEGERHWIDPVEVR